MNIVGGSLNAPTFIKSKNYGNIATLEVGSGEVCTDYIRIQDVSAIGLASYIAGPNSQDLGSTSGWTFALLSDTASDCNAPVISLLGNDPETVEVGATYSDAGATAFDNYDGDLTGSIITESPFIFSEQTTIRWVDFFSEGVQIVSNNNLTQSFGTGIASGAGSEYLGLTDNKIYGWGQRANGPIVKIVDVNSGIEETGYLYNNSGNVSFVLQDGTLLADHGYIPLSDNLRIYFPHDNTSYSDYIFSKVDEHIRYSYSKPPTASTDTVGTHTITYTVSDTAGNEAVQVTRTVNVIETLGVDSIEINSMTVYPNPTDSKWTVASSDVINSIALFNPLGQKILEQKANKTKVNIDASNLETGVYMLQINNTTMKRVLKK